jgi:hypothetical protein
MLDCNVLIAIGVTMMVKYEEFQTMTNERSAVFHVGMILTGMQNGQTLVIARCHVQHPHPYQVLHLVLRMLMAHYGKNSNCRLLIF